MNIHLQPPERWVPPAKQSFPIQLNERWRVAEIKRPRQWVLQRRATLRKGDEHWQSVAFCQTRAGLLAAVKEKVEHAARYRKDGGEDLALQPGAAARLTDLPGRIGY